MTTTDVTATSLKANLGETGERAARGERIRVTRHGRTQFALVSAADLERLERLERLSDLRAAKRVRSKRRKAEPLEDVLRELGL